MSKLFDLSGRLALVTGSSQGIGFAIAKGLTGAGAAVVVNGRDPAKLSGAAKELRTDGAVIHECAFDVTDAEAISAAVKRIEADLGPIDILVNNAGMQFRTSLEDFPHDKWRELMRLNLDSVFLVSQAVARGMITRRRGRIINIASAASFLARPSIAPYTASKGGVKMLTKGMCADWARHGLQVNSIAPGYFRTELNRDLTQNAEFTAWVERRTPAGRWGNLEELAGAAVFLASDAASFVNGQVLVVDGGLTSVF